MSDVTPIRVPPVGARPRRPTLVEPGQSVHDAEWQAGWNAAMDERHASVADGYARGLTDGVRAGMLVGPTWANLLVVSGFAFVIGFCVALGYFGG